ncbi:MAG TPA: isoprenylcysteine carboxylmethyltransferase family protein [Bacteroidetes bacterium]|nr:isoprenylcysteine carboxylmethyltransferase family protein [Bacteroidota bacterium]
MDIREFLFNYRSYTPIPLLIAVLILADPTAQTLLVGFAIALLGESIRIWGVRHAGGATRTTSGAGASSLITHGPFAYVRNPLYVGNFLLSGGLVIMSWAWMPWMLIVFVAVFALQYSMIVSLEEEELHKRFGDEYREYCEQVPRWIPRLRPFKEHDVEPASLARTLKVEDNTLFSFAAVTILLVLKWFYMT